MNSSWGCGELGDIEGLDKQVSVHPYSLIGGSDCSPSSLLTTLGFLHCCLEGDWRVLRVGETTEWINKTSNCRSGLLEKCCTFYTTFLSFGDNDNKSCCGYMQRVSFHDKFEEKIAGATAQHFWK